MTDRTKTAAPYLALIGVQICFGSLPVVGKFVLAVIPAAGLVGFRVAITAVFLAIIQIVRRQFWLADRRDYWRVAVFSFFGVTLNQLLFVSGLSLTRAVNSSLLVCTIPAFTLVIAAMFGSERLRGVKIAGIVLAAGGVLFLIDPRNASFSSQTTLGDLCIIANSVCYSIFLTTSKKVIARNGAIRTMAWAFILAIPFCVPVGYYALWGVDTIQITPSIWVMAAYVAVGATATPYLLNAWALARVNPSVVAVFIYLQPLIGFILAVIFLAEQIDVNFVIAAGLVFAGVFLTTRKARDAVNADPAIVKSGS